MNVGTDNSVFYGEGEESPVGAGIKGVYILPSKWGRVPHPPGPVSVRRPTSLWGLWTPPVPIPVWVGPERSPVVHRCVREDRSRVGATGVFLQPWGLTDGRPAPVNEGSFVRLSGAHDGSSLPSGVCCAKVCLSRRVLTRLLTTPGRGGGTRDDLSPALVTAQGCGGETSHIRMSPSRVPVFVFPTSTPEESRTPTDQDAGPSVPCPLWRVGHQGTFGGDECRVRHTKAPTPRRTLARPSPRTLASVPGDRPLRGHPGRQRRTEVKGETWFRTGTPVPTTRRTLPHSPTPPV